MDQPSSFEVLRGHQYMNLISFRKSGQSVSTPVWFAEEGGRLYVTTSGRSAKVKRIRNNPQVQLAPSDARGNAIGPMLAAVARVLPEPEWGRAEELLNKKYGLVKRLFDFGMRIAGRRRDSVYLEVSPPTAKQP